MKRQMEILQSAQSDAPGEGRLIAGSSGYTDFPAVDAPPTTSMEQPAPVTSPTSTDESPTASEPLLPQGTSSPYTDFSSDGSVVSPATGAGDTDKELLAIAEEDEGVEEGKDQAQDAKQYEASGPSPYLVSTV